MTSERFVQAVARHLATRLHKSTSGYRCRCGGCRHQILAAARRSGLSPRHLLAALPRETPGSKEPERQAPRRRPMTTQVANSVTISRGRRRLQGAGGILMLVEGE